MDGTRCLRSGDNIGAKRDAMSAKDSTITGNQFAAADSPTTLRAAVGVFMSYRSPQILAALAGASLLLRLFLGPVTAMDLLVAATPIVIWPFLEWFLHRYLLHLRPMQIFGWTLDFDFARKHRIHHQQPWRPEHIFLPVYVHATLAPVLTLGAFWLLPQPGLAATWMAALAGMTLVYEWTHFIVHSRIKPRSAFAQKLFQNHRLHHFRNEHYWYSFTVPQVDAMFGTAPDATDVPRTPTCRTLEYGEAEAGTDRAA